MNRDEHLQWCKDRALALVDAGDLEGAFASMCSDVMKHSGTQSHETTNQLGMMLIMTGNLSTSHKMSDWIRGYN